MTYDKHTPPRQRELAIAACAALSLAACLPAYGADPEVEALKQELAAQRQLIEQLLANQKKAETASPNSAEEIDEKLRQQGKKPITAPTVEPNPEAGNTEFKTYGVADVSITNADSGFGHKTRLEGGGGKSASRLGMQVTRTFGNGLKVSAVAEAGVQFDTGSTGNSTPVLGINSTSASTGGANGSGAQIFGRQIWAGITDGFGQISIGRQYTGSYIAVAAVGSAHGDGLYGNTGSFTPIIGGMPTRVNNSIVWATPKFAGLYGVASYTAGSENNVSGSVASSNTLSTSDKAGQGYDLGVFLSRGPFQAAISTWNVYNNAWVTATETGLAKKKGYQLAANYNFGFFRLFGDYVHGTIDGGNYENVTATLSNATGYGISVLVPYGKHNVVVTYTKVDDKSRLDKDGTLFGLSYYYSLTPDTSLYASAGKMKNNANGTYSLNDAGSDVGNVLTPGTSPTGVMLGMNYRF